MSAGPESQVDVNLIEQTRRQINKLVEEVARMSEMDLPPATYYGEFLQRVVTAVAAPAGAVWVRNPQGHLQLMYQINLRDVGLDHSDNERQMHDELLRQAMLRAEPLLIPPHSSTGQGEGGQAVAGNPTRYVILLAPIVVEKTVAGLVEVWQEADRNPNAQQGFLQFLVRMAQLASSYTRNHQLRQMVGQQQLWTQLEGFARQIHASLVPMEVSYLVANEGRRLVDCDRVSVGQRMARKTKIEAISGADVVEKRSNLVRLLAALMDAVLVWGEKLVYSGTKDDSLPPNVLTALDNFLAESNSKLLVALPLKDDRESESKKPSRSCIVMECFDPPASPEQLIARLEVVGRHSTSALYNAAEHKRIPLRLLWQPLAKIQEGLGGKARAIAITITTVVFLVILAMIFVPYPLKMDALGQLLPEERRYLYAPVEGQVEDVKLQAGDPVIIEGQNLVLLRDVQLEMRLLGLQHEIADYEQRLRAMDTTSVRSSRDQANLLRMNAEKQQMEAIRERKKQEKDTLVAMTNSDPDRLGRFWLKAPFNGIVLNMDYRETLLNRLVKPNEPLLRVGDDKGVWEIEIKIPQKHIGQVLQGYHDVRIKRDWLYSFLDRERKKEGTVTQRLSDEDFRSVRGLSDLDKLYEKLEALNVMRKAVAEEYVSKLEVDLLPRSTPTRSFKGTLSRKHLAGEATPNRDDNNEAEPVVLARVRIDDPDILEKEQLPRDLFVTGTEVATKIRCGNKALGYALFYGVWEFIYEKIVFFF